MSRNCKPIARYVSIDMSCMAVRINGMTDEELGRWFRKAVIDFCSGCIDPNTDSFVKSQYDKSLNKMIQRQESNAKYYKNHTARNNDQETNTNESTNEERCHDLETDCSADTTIAPADASNAGKSKELAKPEKKAYGQNKNVMLTDEEGAHLRELYGEDLKMAIDILDAYIENGGRKSRKYKDHAAVMRRGNWVWNKVIETKNNEARLEKTSRPANLKDFKSMREEEQKRRAFSSLYNTEAL